jgi:hypothetical protein
MAQAASLVRGVLRVVGVKLKNRHAPPQRRALRGAAKELYGEAEGLFAHGKAAGEAFHGALIQPGMGKGCGFVGDNCGFCRQNSYLHFNRVNVFPAFVYPHNWHTVPPPMPLLLFQLARNSGSSSTLHQQRSPDSGQRSDRVADIPEVSKQIG